VFGLKEKKIKREKIEPFYLEGRSPDFQSAAGKQARKSARPGA